MTIEKGNGKVRRRAAKNAPELAFDPIDAALRQIHDSIVAETIPEDFLKLLDQLEREPIRRSST